MWYVTVMYVQNRAETKMASGKCLLQAFRGLGGHATAYKIQPKPETPNPKRGLLSGSSSYAGAKENPGTLNYCFLDRPWASKLLSKAQVDPSSRIAMFSLRAFIYFLGDTAAVIQMSKVWS